MGDQELCLDFVTAFISLDEIDKNVVERTVFDSFHLKNGIIDIVRKLLNAQISKIEQHHFFNVAMNRNQSTSRSKVFFLRKDCIKLQAVKVEIP